MLPVVLLTLLTDVVTDGAAVVADELDEPADDAVVEVESPFDDDVDDPADDPADDAVDAAVDTVNTTDVADAVDDASEEDELDDPDVDVVSVTDWLATTYCPLTLAEIDPELTAEDARTYDVKLRSLITTNTPVPYDTFSSAISELGTPATSNERTSELARLSKSVCDNTPKLPLNRIVR